MFALILNDALNYLPIKFHFSKYLSKINPLGRSSATIHQWLPNLMVPQPQF